MDVLQQLEKEHREVEAMLKKLANSEPGSEREDLVDELAESLRKHMAVEERFVYPLVQQYLGEDEYEGAENEHQVARDGLDGAQDLIAEPGFGAAIEALQAGIKHHVEEEEGSIFPGLRERAADDIAQLGDPQALEQAVAKSK